MSYVRWGADGSDIYVYADCDGYFRCCCDTGKDGSDDFKTTLRSEMVKHMDSHVKNNQHVPPWVFEDMKWEIENIGDDYACETDLPWGLS